MFGNGKIREVSNLLSELYIYLHKTSNSNGKESYTNEINELTKQIEVLLGDYFKCKITVKTVNPYKTNSLFVMSVIPEDKSTIDKIIDASLTDNAIDRIKTLWETNKSWSVIIDERIFKTEVINLTSDEFIAIFFHELGHIYNSYKIISRISSIMKYEIMKTSLSNKMMLKDNFFKKFLYVPFISGCTYDNQDKDELMEEVSADKFAVKFGYRKSLITALTKLASCKYFVDNMRTNDKLHNNTKGVLNVLNEFKERQYALSKKGLFKLFESAGPFKDIYYNEVFGTLFNEDCSEESINYFIDKANKVVEEGYYTEFFLFKKNLKPIDSNLLDYIFTKINSIRSENDRMMILSYIHFKIDTVEYYLSIYADSKMAKKYNIPHSEDQLRRILKRLNELRIEALRYKIPDRNKGLLVAYPQGYEG